MPSATSSHTSTGRSLSALAWWATAAVVAATVVVAVVVVDVTALADAVGTALSDPLGLVVAFGCYATAFVARAAAWGRVVDGLPLRHAVAALHVSTGANHVLPLRLGEALRVTSVVRRTDVDTATATASTVALRSADVIAVFGIALLAGPTVAVDLLGAWWPLLVVGVVGAAGVAGWWLVRLGRDRGGVHLPGPTALALTVASWVLEAAVVWQVARWVGAPVPVVAAVVVTAVAIAAQVAAIAPGGFGTYEAAASAALVAVGLDPATALTTALVAHALKTVYALVTGAVFTMTPAPSLFGRLRLPRARARRPEPAPISPDQPVVLFMPAHNEEELVAGVVARVPTSVLGHDVVCLVIDDGSTDRTAALAAGAGAEVIALPSNRGLGAGVRRGLAEGVARDAAAVVFCDADGEYAPEELDRLVAPILDGTADYVVGSRFDGDIEHMLPHRRFGNRVLTHVVRFVTRQHVNDGQSGYRAFTRSAAAQARVVHDFNYAQVITIDLLRRGFTYLEVPISYHFRTAGRSFVRLGRYLRAVVPAIWHSLNDDLDDPHGAVRTVALDHAAAVQAPTRT